MTIVHAITLRQVHGDIRHLERGGIVWRGEHYVHGDIRHLESNKSKEH